MSLKPLDRLSPLFLHVPRGRGSILLWRCDTLRTSGFVDDVTFGRSWLYGVFHTSAEFDAYECLVSYCCATVDVQATFVIHKESDAVNVIECDGIGLDNTALTPAV